MGKEIKIGLSVIGLLLCVFGGVLFMRLRREKPDTARAKVAAAKKEGKVKSAKKPAMKPAEAKLDRYGRRLDTPDAATLADDDLETAAAEVNRFDAPALASSPYRNRPAPDRYGHYDEAAVEQPDESNDLAVDDANAQDVDVAMPEDRFGPQTSGGIAFSDDNEVDGADASADRGDAADSTMDATADRFGMRTEAVENDSDQPVDDADTDNTPVQFAPVEDNDSELRPASVEHDADQQIEGDTYAVEPDDNFWRISQKVYGTGAYFKALEEHNRRQYGDRVINAGDVISVPRLAELRQNYPDLAPKPRTVPVNRRGAALAGSATRRGERTYTVVEGDTLFDIARHELGKASRWSEIYQLNREQLGEDFNELSPGIQLVLPAGGDQVDPVSSRPAPRENYRR